MIFWIIMIDLFFGTLVSYDFLDYHDRFVLWNPSIRRVVDIPRPNFGFHPGTHSDYALGFGFDSISDDYKLVRVLYLRDYVELDIPLGDDTPVVEVYSLRSRSWRFVPNHLKHVIEEAPNPPVVNGACHWVAYTPDLRYFQIVSFHFGDEVFGELSLPRPLDACDGSSLTLGVLGGCLCGLALIPDDAWSVWENSFVWVMKEYGNARSWSKLYEIEGES